MTLKFQLLVSNLIGFVFAVLPCSIFHTGTRLGRVPQLYVVATAYDSLISLVQVGKGRPLYVGVPGKFGHTLCQS